MILGFLKTPGKYGGFWLAVYIIGIYIAVRFLMRKQHANTAAFASRFKNIDLHCCWAPTAKSHGKYCTGAFGLFWPLPMFKTIGIYMVSWSLMSFLRMALSHIRLSPSHDIRGTSCLFSGAPHNGPGIQRGQRRVEPQGQILGNAFPREKHIDGQQ